MYVTPKTKDKPKHSSPNRNLQVSQSPTVYDNREPGTVSVSQVIPDNQLMVKSDNMPADNRVDNNLSEW